MKNPQSKQGFKSQIKFSKAAANLQDPAFYKNNLGLLQVLIGSIILTHGSRRLIPLCITRGWLTLFQLPRQLSSLVRDPE